MTDDLIGKTLGRYEILEVIGHGGMATVYKARQTSMNRTVALKILPRHLMRDDTYLQRFEREVKIVAQLEHRNIVPVHDYGEHDNQPFIAMRYMPGGSVREMIETGTLDEQTVLDIITQIAPALDYAHSKNVLHRDLKPSNILLDDNGGAYITDFGIARILGTEDKSATITTQGVVGTPSYMSPEQAQGKPLDSRSDVYSLGIMLFEMMTGRRPFIGDTPYGIAIMQVTTPPPLPRTLNPEVTGAVEQVILKSLKKHPENRYPTAVQLAESLRLAIERPESIHDTQPRPLPAPQALEAPPPAAVQPLPMPESTTKTPASQVLFPPIDPARSLPFSISPPIKRRRVNLWLSMIIGALIGCGLLSVVGLVAVMTLNNLFNETSVPTPAIAPPTDDPNVAVEDPTRTPVFVGATPIIRTPDMTSEPVTGTADTQPTPTFPPDFDPQSGEIVYFANVNGQFHIIRHDLRSGETRQLTGSETDDETSDNSYPLVSPDGKRIVFQSDRDGDFDIYVMELASGETRQLTHNTTLDRVPSWSPDGIWIIYSADVRSDGNLDLYRVPANGGEPELVYSDGNRSSHARYSPDGRFLVFTNGESGDATAWEIILLDLSTGETVRLTDNTVRDASPSFAPDGNAIIYATSGEGLAAIATLPLTPDGEPSILYDGPGFEWGMSYSPNGTFIVFNSQVGENSTLYLMHADGTDLREIETEHNAFYPSWIP